MQIQISWLLQKPTDLDLHCLLRQGIFCSAREGLTLTIFRTNTADHNCWYIFCFTIKLALAFNANCLLKCWILFSWKKDTSKCYLLNFLPSTLHVNVKDLPYAVTKSLDTLECLRWLQRPWCVWLCRLIWICTLHIFSHWLRDGTDVQADLLFHWSCQKKINLV